MKKEYMKVVFFSLIALLITTGCQKKAAEPVDVADSSAVVDTAQKEAEERAAAERKAEEERLAAEAAQRAEEERMAAEAEVQRKAEEERMAVEAAGRNSHTVVKGESLWKISESSDVYADPFQWPVIYKANRDQIKDPDLIYPDQQFELPRDSSQEDIDAAVHEAKTRGPWSLWDGK